MLFSEPFFQKNLEFFLCFFQCKKCVLLQNFPTFAKWFFCQKKKKKKKSNFARTYRYQEKERERGEAFVVAFCRKKGSGVLYNAGETKESAGFVQTKVAFCRKKVGKKKRK